MNYILYSNIHTFGARIMKVVVANLVASSSSSSSSFSSIVAGLA